MRTNLQSIQRCPWCWNFLIHLAIKQALEALWIEKENVVFVTWIGCGSKMSQYMDCYWAETLHGRGIPFATGVKLANPKLTVISLSGDGDTYGIGLWHLLHAARNNINILHITCDNENYALTTGQASPTTPLDVKTNSTPNGNQTQPFDPVKLLESAGCGFVKRVDWKDLNWMKETIKEAIQYEWFSHINVNQPCPSWRRW